ncbi:MAG: hypothetical protein GX455_00890 [Phycisphaerae bacterium]|nr:hypothetical protein [Phycisphaerae bacterium]
MKHKSGHIVFRSWILFAVVFQLIGLATADFFVSPQGNDTNPGTQDKPFATLEAARDALRALKANPLPSGGVTIWLAGGDYPRTKTFELSSADSGTADVPIIYRNIEKQIPRLLGGRKISGFAPVTDSSILSRLDEKARGKVLSINLKVMGIHDYGQLRSRGFGRATAPAHLELFFAGKPMTLARWPNEGQFEKIASIPPDTARGDDHGGKIGDLKAGFFYAGDRPKQWKSLDNIWVHGYWSWDWANSYEKIESIDLDKRLIKTLSPYGLYGFRPGQRFYFVNILEELDEPGEYYVDSASGLLYFWPSADPASGETLVSLLESPLIALKDVSNVTFRSMVFEATRGNALTIDGGEKNSIVGCIFRQLGDYAIQINAGHNHHVISCDISHTGDGGISISGGDRQTLTPAGHAVLNSHFHHQGRWSKCYVPAVLASGVGIKIANNLIHDHPHCAILYSGNDHIIEGNEIHHIALETGDVGAIYSGRDWTYRGNIIRHNFIHETGGVGMGSMGVYMDDCVSGTEIVGNIFYRVTRAAFLGGGRDHHVINNIFVDCSPAVALDGRGMDTSPVWHNMVSDYMKNRLADVPAELYRSRYPALKDLDKYYASDSRFPPEGNVVARNICVGGQWLSVGWNSAESILDLKDNYLGQPSDLVAPDKMDFRPKSECPAFKSGFEAIPTDKIGLQSDAFRIRSPDGSLSLVN